MPALALLGPAQQKELAEPRVGLLVAALVLLLLLVPVPRPSEVVVIASASTKAIAVAAAAPPRRHVPRLRRGVRVGTPRFLSGARRAHSLPAPRAWQSKWQHILRDLTELAQPPDTHYSAGNSLCSRIDRIYTTIPPWMLLQLNVRAYIPKDPKEMHDLQLSDHSILEVYVSDRDPLPLDQRPISRHVVSDPLYAEHLQKLVNVSNLEALAVPLRLRHFKL